MKKSVIGLSLATLVLSGAVAAAPPAPGAPPAMKRDADANGVVTRAEAQKAAAGMFAQIDVNKDGTFDRADRQAQVDAMRTRMFDRLDTNKDGQISRAEFTADRGPGEHGPRMGRRGPGRPSPDGARGSGRGMGEPMTQAQFVAAALQRFDAADTNKDGQVTQAERQTYHEQRKAQRQQTRAAKPQG